MLHKSSKNNYQHFLRYAGGSNFPLQGLSSIYSLYGGAFIFVLAFGGLIILIGSAPILFPSLSLNMLLDLCKLRNLHSTQIRTRPSGDSLQISGTYGTVDIKMHTSDILPAAGTPVRKNHKTLEFALLLDGAASQVNSP